MFNLYSLFGAKTQPMADGDSLSPNTARSVQSSWTSEDDLVQSVIALSLEPLSEVTPDARVARTSSGYFPEESKFQTVATYQPSSHSTHSPRALRSRVASPMATIRSNSEPLPKKYTRSVSVTPGSHSSTMQYALQEECSPSSSLEPSSSITAYRKPARTNKPKSSSQSSQDTSKLTSQTPGPVGQVPRNPGEALTAPPGPTHRAYSDGSGTTQAPAKRASRQRAISSPTSKRSVQCSADTKAGIRCQKKIVVDEFSLTMEHRCHHHKKSILDKDEAYLRVGGLVTFSEWISKHIRADTQIALRTEMNRPLSDSDEDGYIYVILILICSDMSAQAPESPDTIQLKVGRTKNVAKRIDEWSKQCGSKKQVLRAYFPEKEEGGGRNTPSLMKGCVRPGKPGPWSHRLERLIHLELRDLATTKVYLDPEWQAKPFAEDAPGALTPKIPPVKRVRCDGCGQVHQEIFEFTRIESGMHKGREFELIVKPVIEKWGKFIDEYYAAPAACASELRWTS